MSAVRSPPAVDHDDVEEEPGHRRLWSHDGVEAANARRCDDAPPIGFDSDPTDGVLSVRGMDVDTAGLTEREREVWLSVDVHGIRPADLAIMTDAEESTIRSLLHDARRKRQ